MPDSSVQGIIQARILEWVAIPFSGDLPNLGIESMSLMSPALAGRFFTTTATWEIQGYSSSVHMIQIRRPINIICHIMNRRKIIY